MERIVVEPRTPAWHAMRNESWTASSAATLVVRENAQMLQAHARENGVHLDIQPLLDVGMLDFYGNTPWKLWAEKTGAIPRFMGNADTERGVRHEENVILHFEKVQEIQVEREVTGRHLTHKWLAASLDAWAPPETDLSVHAPYGFPVEAKCPEFPSRQKMFKAFKDCGSYVMGLPYYWCQVQHQILVAEAPYGWFVAMGVEEKPDGTVEPVFPIIERVERDDRFLRAYLAIAEYYYHAFLESYMEPPKLPSDYMLLAHIDLESRLATALREENHTLAVELYQDALAAEKAATERREALEAKVLAAAAALREEGQNKVMLADMLEVEYVPRQGTVSWQKAAKQLAMDLVSHTGGGNADALLKEVADSVRGKATEQVKTRFLVQA